MPSLDPPPLPPPSPHVYSPLVAESRNGWTGGQYSIARAVLGLVLAGVFVAVALDLTCVRAPADAAAPAWAGASNPFSASAPASLRAALSIIGAGIALALAAGFRDRGAAIILIPLYAALLCGQPSVLRGLGSGALLALALHASTPTAPFGALDARGRLSPGGNWRMPPALQLAAWIAMALTYAAMAFGAAGLDGVVLGPSWILAHVYVFDPAWIRGQAAAAPDRLYYDGHCGLCHDTVRLILAEDPSGDRVRFSPLQGATFKAELGTRTDLPDSMIVQTADGRLLVRSAAFLHVLARLGGLWRIAGAVLRIVPRSVRDRAYDGVARVRKKIFGSRDELCPRMPSELRARFDP
jgi:predicted DCC family thiol-disulfide oxidoreductase YuxK